MATAAQQKRWRDKKKARARINLHHEYIRALADYQDAFPETYFNEEVTYVFAAEHTRAVAAIGTADQLTPDGFARGLVAAVVAMRKGKYWPDETATPADEPAS